MVADRNNYPRLLATNGQEAVDAYISPKEANQSTKQGRNTSTHIPNSRPDVVLLDLNMPVMNGFVQWLNLRYPPEDLTLTGLRLVFEKNAVTAGG